MFEGPRRCKEASLAMVFALSEIVGVRQDEFVVLRIFPAWTGDDMGSSSGQKGHAQAVTKLAVVEGNITTQDVDAIVNAANPSLLGGGGVDGAIHRAAGPTLLAECRAIVARQGRCAPGEAVVTGAGLLPSRWVVHTVGPVWTDDRADEHDRTLTSCYKSSLDCAAGVSAMSIAFPAISSGIYGFPKNRASTVAVDAVRAWVAEHPDSSVAEVRFVCFSPADAERYRLRVRR